MAHLLSKIALVGLLAGCGVIREPVDNSLSHGVSTRLVAECVDCHRDIGASWKNEFSHSLLFDCSQCHGTRTTPPGTRHATTRDCSDCHSETMHESQQCTVCHDPHGSENRFLVRAKFFQGPVTLTAPEGLSAQGLAHSDGTGVCEVCHNATKYSRADGKGAAHYGTWCVECHSHQAQFIAR